ncbi:MAG: gamma-glutamylcyclotransferase [Lachnospiraceae bacterium]|nr:gamma-glutamylcyclotransferase [Lachnospiraceae bacterium]
MGKLYIAYGSNLNLAQMAARCPSASVYAKGILNNWALVYRGSKTNSHATIIRKPGSSVPVLVWEIQPADEYRLDIYEGYPRYYFKRNIMVSLDSGKRKAMVYIMNEKHLPGRPSPQYIRTILQGYMDNDMDIGIFKKSLELNSIECK